MTLPMKTIIAHNAFCVVSSRSSFSRVYKYSACSPRISSIVMKCGTNNARKKAGGPDCFPICGTEIIIRIIDRKNIPNHISGQTLRKPSKNFVNLFMDMPN